METIDHFRGKYGFLSNMSPSPMTMKVPGSNHEIIFPTVEHYYVAMKSMRLDDWVRISQIANPGEAKRAGRRLLIRQDWDKIKLTVMEQALRAKFRIPELRDKLLATDDVMLIEGNTWNDTFWGMCRGVGHNHLGRLLMAIRHELRT